MVLTVNTPYARCEVVSQVDATTIEVDTVTGEPLGPNWVGRAFYAIWPGRDGQWRKITAVDVGNSTITMEYPWRQSTSDPLIAATGGAKTATDSPAYEYDLTEAGTILYVSHRWADLEDGVNVVVDGPYVQLLDRVRLFVCFVWSVNEMVSAGHDGTFADLHIEDTGRYVQGQLSQGGYGHSGGGLKFSTVGASGLISWCNDSRSNQATLCGVNVQVDGTDRPIFGRFYGNTRSLIRMIDCTQNGNMAGRWSGAKSFILRHQGFGYDESLSEIGMIGSADPFGGTFGFVAQDARQALYHNGSIGGAAQVDGIIARNISSQLIRVADAGNGSRMTLSNLDWDEQGDLAVWDTVSGFPLVMTMSWTVNVTNAGSAQSGGRLRVVDSTDAEVYNDTNDSGTFDDIPDLVRAFFESGDQTIADGDARTPHSWRYRRYGAIQQSGTHTADTPYAELIVAEIDDTQITLSEAAVAALTGLSMTFGGKTIAVAESHTVSEIYDWQKYKATESDNMQYDDEVTSSNSQIDLADWTLRIDSGTVTCPLDREVTTTGEIEVNSPGVLQTPVTLTSGTLNTSVDFRMDGAADISGTAVFEMENISNASLPAHVFGAGGKLLISGATVDTTLDLRGSTFDATSVIENTSGENITVRIDPAATVPVLTETSGTITIDNAFTSTINLPNIIDDSKYLFFIDGVATGGLQTVSGGSGISEAFTAGTDFTAGDSWEVWIVYYESGTGPGRTKIELDITGSFGSSTETITRTESQEDCPIYTALGWDGADYDAQYSIDNAGDEVDIDVGGPFDATQMFAYLKYAQTVSEANLLDLFGEFGADDIANYWFADNRLTVRLDNTSGTRAQESSGVRWYTKSGTGDPVKTGENIDINWREKVYTSVVTVASPVITGDIADIPATVWDAPIASHQVAGSTGKALDDAGGGGSVDVTSINGMSVTGPDDLKADVSALASQVSVDAIPINPLLTNDVRLDNLDVAISTRSDFDHTTDQVVASNMRGTDGANTVAPDNAGIAAIQAKTDELTFTAGDVHATLDGEEVTTDAASRTASQANVSALASQASVDAIPTNPLLDDDARLNNLDAPISGAGDATAANQAMIAGQISSLNNLSQSEAQTAAEAGILALQVATQSDISPVAADVTATRKLAEADLDFDVDSNTLRVLERGTVTDLVPPKTVTGTQQRDDASITE